MKYLPIFQELFEFDSIVFMLIGLILAILIGIKMNGNSRSRRHIFYITCLYSIL